MFQIEKKNYVLQFNVKISLCFKIKLRYYNVSYSKGSQMTMNFFCHFQLLQE